MNTNNNPIDTRRARRRARIVRRRDDFRALVSRLRAGVPADELEEARSHARVLRLTPAAPRPPVAQEEA